MAKKALTILLDTGIYSSLEKRAKKNLLSLRELISDILRRSVLSSGKRKNYMPKSKDKFIEYFSRHKAGRKRKKRKKKK